MARPRKQTYTLNMYLDKIRDKDISNNADVQRNFVWKNEQVNELIYTVLTDDYIPPIILGEVDGCQLYIVDGGQRSSSLSWFKYGNYRITKSIETSILQYKSKVIDENGNISWEDKEINLVGKTYETLPQELKKKFDEYQLETVIHENCTMRRISELIKKYNLHTSMNTNEKALTYIPDFAKKVRDILVSDFFVNHGNYSVTEKNNGTIERILLESDMLVNHFDKWNKEAKRIAKYLNDNASENEFDELNSCFDKLAKVITPNVSSMFTSKDTFLWIGLYKRFSNTGLKDEKFIEFLDEFNKSEEMKNREIDGQTYNKLCINPETQKSRGTKDKRIVESKLHILEILMYEFLRINRKVNKPDTEKDDCVQFVKNNIEIDMDDKEIESYIELFKEDLSIEIDNSSKLMEEHNLPSMVAAVIHSVEIGMNSTQLKAWLVDFFDRNNTYILNQKENYKVMANDMDNFNKKWRVA